MRISVYPDGSVVVIAPPTLGQSAISRFVGKNLDWIRQGVKWARRHTVLRIARSEIPELRKRALELATARAEHFAAIYGLTYNKITIRGQKTRWGSCSKKGNLSFNYKIALLPPRLADCLVVHELCHLAEFNHSKRFWALMARTIPDHKELRKALHNTATMFT